MGGKGSPWYLKKASKIPPQVLKPSQEYLQLVAAAPPLGPTLPPPRKLLILSLGSTLTLRTGNRNAPIPRAYLPVFMRYVTHADTKKWADVMVWSNSARKNADPGVRSILRGVIDEGVKERRAGTSRGRGRGVGKGRGRTGRNEESSKSAPTHENDGDKKPFWDGLLFDVWSQETVSTLKGQPIGSVDRKSYNLESSSTHWLLMNEYFTYQSAAS